MYDDNMTMLQGRHGEVTMQVKMTGTLLYIWVYVSQISFDVSVF